MKHSFFALFLLLLVFCTAHAEAINGTFDNLSGWTAIGDVSLYNGQALITNLPAYAYGIDTSLTQPISEVPSVDIFSNFESFFGTPGFSGDWLGTFSGIKTTFEADAGDIVSFDWNQAWTLWPYPGFMILDGIMTCPGLSKCDSSATINMPQLVSSTIFDWEGGPLHMEIPTTTAGEHTLSFGVTAHLDQEGATAFMIDNVFVFTPIPEPTSLLLLGTGLGVIGFAASRRRKI